MSELSPRQRELRAKFEARHGHWDAFWEGLLTLTPDFFEACERLLAIPLESSTLPPKIKELLLIAINASTTHLFEPGIREHVRRALRYGATKEEILEVYQLTSSIGMHTFTMGMPLMTDEFRKARRGAEVELVLDERQAALKAAFMRNRGYWNAFWEDLVALSPDFFEAYLNFSSIPWTPGVLSPKVKEFVYIAVDAATTHLYEPGLRIHIANALKYGATKEEIVEVYQLTTTLGIHTCAVGIPILLDELNKQRAPE